MAGGEEGPVVFYDTLTPGPESYRIPVNNRYASLPMDVGNEEEVRTEKAQPGKRKCVHEEPPTRLIPLIMHSETAKLASLPRSDLVKAFRGLSGLTLTYKCMRGGDLLLFPNNMAECEILKGVVSFGGHSVEVKLPKTATGCRGIIRGVSHEYTVDSVLQLLQTGSIPVTGVKFLRNSSGDDNTGAKNRNWTVLIDFDGPICSVLNAVALDTQRKSALVDSAVCAVGVLMLQRPALMKLLCFAQTARVPIMASLKTVLPLKQLLKLSTWLVKLVCHIEKL